MFSRRTENALRFIALVLLVLIATGCAALNPYSVRPDQERASEHLNWLEQRAENARLGEVWLRYGYNLWFLKNDMRAARNAFMRGLDAETDARTRAEAHLALALIGYLGGDTHAALTHALAALQAEPGGTFAAQAARLLAELYDDAREFPQDVRPVAERLLASDVLIRPARRELVRVMERLALEAGQADLARRMRDQNGEITRYSLLGPFGVFGVLNFERRFGPEDAAPLSQSYQSDAGALSPLRLDRDERDVDFSDLSPFGGVFYAVSWVHVARDAEAVLRLQTPDLTALYVDGQEVAQNDIRGSYLPPFVEASLELSEGWHKLTVKLAGLRPPARFSLYLTDRAGRPLAREQRTQMPENVTLATHSTHAGGAVSQPWRWLDQARENGDQRALLYALSSGWLGGDFRVVERAYALALGLNPGFSPAHVLAGLALQDNPTVPARVAAERQRRMMAVAASADPAQALARLFLADHYAEHDLYEQAIAELHELKEMAYANYVWDARLFAIYRSKGWMVEAERALDAALALNDRNLPLLHAALAFHLFRGKVARAEQLIERIDRLDGPGQARAEWYAELGESRKAIEKIQADLTWPVPDDARRLALAEAHLAAEEPEAAVAILRVLADAPGRFERYARILSRALLAAGNREEAREMLRRAQSEHPEAFALRRALAFLDGRELLDDYIHDAFGVIAAYRADDWQPDAGAVEVLDECIVKLLPNGARVGRVHQITHIRTKEAADAHGERLLPEGAEVYRLRVIKADGRVILPEPIVSKASISFSGLEVGDFIEVDYAEGDGVDARLAGGRLAASRYYFKNNKSPVFRSRLVLIRPPDLALDRLHLNYGLAAPRVSRDGDDNEVIVYENSRLDAIVPEPFMPLEEETHPLVQLSRPVSWRDIRDWRRQHLVLLTRPSLALETFYKQTVQPQMSEKDALRALFDTVKARIDGDEQDWGLTRSAAHILESGSGSRLIVLAALLNIAGMDHAIVLAAPHTIKEIPYKNGNFSAYDDPLLEVRLSSGERVYLSTRFAQSPFDRPSPLLSVAKAMRLEKGAVFGRLPYWNQIGEDKEIHLFVELMPDGSARVEALERLRGYYAVQQRRTLKALAKDRLAPTFEIVLNRHFPGAKIDSADVQGVDNPEQPIEIRYDFRVSRLGQKLGGKLRMPSRFFTLDLSHMYIRTPARNFPLLISTENSSYNTLIVQAPAGMRLSKAPRSQTIQSRFGVYRLEAETRGGLLFLTRSFALPVQRIEPSDYMDFYRFLSAIDRLERETLLFSPETLAIRPNTRRPTPPKSPNHY